MGVVTDIRPEDIAELRKQGDLRAFLRQLTGRPTSPESASAIGPDVEDEPPCYHIPRRGAWPCGTAATGPSPGPTCPDCAA